MAKKMGLPMNKLIIATNKNDILQRVINTGDYKPDKVKPSLSPSMDIQVSSNFERLLYDVLNSNDNKVSSLMNDLSLNGSFKLSKNEVKIIKKDFCAEKISDDETVDIIKKFELKYNFILDPHTATAVGASRKVKNDSDTIVLATAHPYKFLETIELATGKKIDPPSQLLSMIKKEEKYDILENDILEIKNYILKKIV